MLEQMPTRLHQTVYHNLTSPAFAPAHDVDVHTLFQSSGVTTLGDVTLSSRPCVREMIYPVRYHSPVQESAGLPGPDGGPILGTALFVLMPP